MKIRNVFCRLLILFAFVQAGQAFDVKVLLQKNRLGDVSQPQIELRSDQGFIFSTHANLSIGYEYKGRSLVLSYHHEKLFVNNKSLDEKIVYISPMLSKAHLLALKSQISCWLETNRKDLDCLAQPLYALFDRIVDAHEPLDIHGYDQLNEHVACVSELFFHDLFESMQTSPAITTETLNMYADEFFDNRAKNLFLEALASHHLTKQDRQRLQKDKRHRYEFFLHELHGVVQKLLFDFLPVLPRKFLKQILHEDVGAIEFQGNAYLGSFLLFQEKKQLYLINSLDIDDYLYSVIKHEGWPGWPLEMNKVLAIACRTYLIWQVLQAQKNNRPYHIENGIKHQTYKGHHGDEKLKQAVDQTRDMFIAFDDKPACAMFDACCGGVVPAYIDDSGLKQYSYLARTYPCTFCKNFKVFNWRVDLTSEQIINRLQKDFPKIIKLVDMSVQKKDRAGLVKKISINVGCKKIVITEKKMKSLFPELKSYCFDICKLTNKRYEIIGKGQGHHRGLCQWGACKLVKDDHWNFSEVLQFYYPGTKLMKLSYQR